MKLDELQWSMNDADRTITAARERVAARSGVTAEWRKQAAHRYAPARRLKRFL